MKRLINRQPSSVTRAFLGILPLVLALLVYQWGSTVRKAENPQDKLLPGFVEIHDAMERMALTPSKRTGELLMWEDTKSSLKRLVSGVAIAAAIGLTVGLLTGAIPLFGASLTPVITVISLIPPMALLPILFIVFGIGEVSKVVLIVIGVAPFLIRDLYQRTCELPREQLVKSMTLGANSGQIIFRVLLPQILPRLFASVRLSLGAAWLFLIASEAVASTDGLGYRIFLVRRYMSMDVILPYVAWITLLAFLIDCLLQQSSKRLFPWYHAAK
ncbi:ABC transporter permease [Microbulbifer sp.]|uniref:ABC transporter permease n=1 Tax=Microbulbifer sp. TaxID=1908541 RepID=UPI003F2DF7F0